MPPIGPRRRNAAALPNRNDGLLPRLCDVARTRCVKTHVAPHTKSPLTISLCVCHRACARARARTRAWVRRGVYALGLAMRHADGLSCSLLCDRLGVGVQAVLGPSRQRFALVLIQTIAAAIYRHYSNGCRSEVGVCVKRGQIL